ncbi:LysR family substrate-binding domain-containing protein [Agromyces sp. H3Y2-19a]|uniref:LysR family substrate-binding domain-containing protein n=1 Tax=Agromyces TaxID=33877 RepID=UPI001E48932F|nr:MULTISPECIES: LysR family substrate-binding domain-containing protein [Agromyces]MCD5346180.1 LysR family substrate-binding domain-containing protein [Agromyces sp. S2-1-8]MDF0512547.1 LysR family substrate-binding domain-containing protein [Agromyces chromiiresistens]
MALRLDYVAGVSPSKWLRAWGERRADLPLEAARVDESVQLDRLRSGEVDLAFVRLPVDADGLHLIPLWEELAVVVLPKDHAFAEEAELSLADLGGEPVAPVQTDPAMTLELVAAGTGYAIVPHSIARLHHRRDVVAIPLSDGTSTRIALVWRVERDDDDIQEFVGVVRGRGVRSSRGDEAPTMKPAKAAKLAAAERRAADGRGGKAGGAKGGKAASGRAAPRTGQGAKQRHRRRGR